MKKCPDCGSKRMEKLTQYRCPDCGSRFDVADRGWISVEENEVGAWKLEEWSKESE